jgi:hypothetical protein
MNNINEKEQLIIKTLIESKIEEIEKAKKNTKVVMVYVQLDQQAINLRKILNKIEQA